MHCNTQDHCSADQLPATWYFAQEQQGVENAVDCFHSRDNSGSLSFDALLCRHIERVCKCCTDESHEGDSGDIRYPPGGPDNEKCREKHDGSRSLLIQAYDPACIVGGKIAVSQCHDRVGEVADHPPDNTYGSVVCHGKLRDGDQHTDKQDDCTENALFF